MLTEKDSLAGCSLSGYRDEWIGTNQTVFQVDDAGNIEDDGTRSLNLCDSVSERAWLRILRVIF
ncbi:Uncharacterised protein [Segatella copri]|nr:Uncharacterised protein [Segatella copri]